MLVLGDGAMLGLMNLSFYMALQSIPMAVAISIEFLGPLCVAMLHAQSRADYGALGLATGGLTLLMPWHLCSYRDFVCTICGRISPSGLGLQDA